MYVCNNHHNHHNNSIFLFSSLSLSPSLSLPLSTCSFLPLSPLCFVLNSIKMCLAFVITCLVLFPIVVFFYMSTSLNS